MISWALVTGVVRERRLRHAIGRALKPFLDHSLASTGADAERRWASDFGVGFLASLVTLTARRIEPELGTEALGLLQVSGWSALTGLDDGTIGTRIMLLSSSEDAEFAAGCRAALVFDAALQGAWPGAGDEQVDERGFPLPPAQPFGASARTPDLASLWDRLWGRDPS